ncbi:MAG: hypothetical protein E7006_03875 [Alphaproteobacteria bacterium]|nr:hypothetical protein [Alphaproteobacteria bacterium]
MKVKNIAFSGFMAAILMGVSGAHAAINVASQAYVDGKLKNKADVAAVTTLEGNVSTLSQTVADNKSATDAAIQANADAIALKADQSALTELAGNVYTKEAADALLAGKVDNAALDNYYTKSETYTDDRIEQRITETLTSLEGGNINLGGYAKTDYVDTELAKKADKSVVDGIVTALGTTSDVTAAIADAKKAGTDAQGEVDALEGVVSTLTQTVATNKSDAANAIADAEQAAKDYADQQITALNLDTTYEKVGVAAGLDATLKSELQGEISAAQAAAEQKVTNLANGQVATNTSAIATNAAAIAQKQDTLNANQLSATNSGITAEKVSSYDTAVSELANKISMPEVCKQANGNCVLGIMGGQVQWINLTEPVEEPVQA